MTPRKKAKDLQERYDTVSSVLAGLYDEIDKLCKKAPAEPVTDLAVAHINSVIGEVKDLLEGDPFIDELQPFVPAGENPELRDALMVLRMLKQGIARHGDEFRSTYY